MPPEVLLLPKIVLTILGFLLFQMKLNNVLSKSLKNFAGVFFLHSLHFSYMILYSLASVDF